jgi:hypothetical protein
LRSPGFDLRRMAGSAATSASGYGGVTGERIGADRVSNKTKRFYRGLHMFLHA